MSTAVNFSSLQLTTTAASTDRFLLNVSTVLSGVDAFNQISLGNVERSLSVYSTVQSNSGSWIQSLSFNSSNAQLSISNGNTISLSALSASSTGGGNNLTIFREVSSIVTPNNVTTVHALSVNSLSANVDFAIIAKGNGATLAQIPNLSASGGNKRGQYATDWQKLRNGITQVASGNYSVIGGGIYNTASGTVASVGGGSGNTANSLYATIGGGISNNANGPYTTIGGGATNIASGSQATIAGGTSNNASGPFSTIPGGYAGYAPNYGQYAYASSYFSSGGDGQHFQYVLYGSSFGGNAVALTVNNANYLPNDSGVPSLFIAGQNMAVMLTVQIIGFDDSGNYSSGLRQIVVRKLAANSYNEEILLNTAIGTANTSAGAFTFEINTNATPEHVFMVTGSSNSGDNTRWVAHVSGTWVYQPPSYS